MPVNIDRHAILDQEDILIDHVGEVTKDSLSDLLPKVEKLLDERGASKLLKKRVVYLSIETLQNLQLHGSGEEMETQYPPEFILSYVNGCFNITISNVVAEEPAYILKDKLIKINSLDQDELAYLFGIVIKQSVVRISSKGGAGLGLIDMRKKSTRKLQFLFQDLEGGMKFFSLKISLPEEL